MMIAFAARKDVMIHDISSTPAESEPCMCGRATFVTLVSRICITVTSMTEKVMSHFRTVDSGAVAAGGARSRAPGAVLTRSGPGAVNQTSALQQTNAR